MARLTKLRVAAVVVSSRELALRLVASGKRCRIAKNVVTAPGIVKESRFRQGGGSAEPAHRPFTSSRVSG